MVTSFEVGAVSGRILLVDDDPTIRSAYARVLTRHGHAVRSASDAVAAQNLLAREEFDAVLTDVKMPHTSGIDLLRTLRAAGNDIPVVLMTGNASLDAAIQAVGLGALEFVLKPVEIDTLANSVARAVARRRHDRRARAAGERIEAEDVERTRLSLAFDAALDGLWMANQPIVSAETGAPVAFEALMRTTARELPGPGPILDAAERLGRLPELGRAIRKRVAEGQADAPAGSLRFVNLHPLDLLDDALYVAGTPFAACAKSVVLEITERASLQQIPDLAQRLAALRALGFRLAVDDLGAGYAGLASLAELEPEIVKIDASLVRNIEREPRRRRLLSALIEFCRSNGTTVVAEGVEHQVERDTLRELGCDWLQGYFFARPAAGFPVPARAA